VCPPPNSIFPPGRSPPSAGPFLDDLSMLSPQHTPLVTKERVIFPTLVPMHLLSFASVYPHLQSQRMFPYFPSLAPQLIETFMFQLAQGVPFPFYALPSDRRYRPCSLSPLPSSSFTSATPQSPLFSEWLTWIQATPISRLKSTAAYSASLIPPSATRDRLPTERTLTQHS